MRKSRVIINIVVLAVVAAAVTAAVLEARKRKLEADAVVEDIEAQLDELDPLTRAAVVGKVGADLSGKN